MDTGIGSTLRAARNRRKVELLEAESATKIRLRYLRAMEREDWEVLPGGAYTRAFIRTYGSYLGLDGERLADDYRRSQAPSEAIASPRVEPAGSAVRGAAPRRGLTVAVVAAVAAVGLLVGIGLAGGGDDAAGPQRGGGAEAAAPEKVTAQGDSPDRGLELELAASAEVWVCLLDGAGEALIDGRILPPGAEDGPFHSDRFTASFGNGEVTMLVDGEEAEIPATSSPIGYEVRPGGELIQLSESERPSCE